MPLKDIYGICKKLHFKYKTIAMREQLKCLIIFLLPVLFCGCTSQTSKKVGEVKSNTDTVYKDIPSWYQRENVHKYNLELDSTLDLRSIEGGVEDLQLRIWVDQGAGRYDTSKLFIFTITEDSSVTGKLYTYILSYDSLWNPSGTAYKTIKVLTPSSGWNLFLDSLKRMEIYDLPHYQKLNGYYVSSDTYGVTVEIAAKNRYRIYHYPNYSDYKDKIDAAGKMYKIMQLLEQEFNVKAIY
ncbi:MAG: hypothetical protein WDO19_02205 [Bacteroidota bacterium]